MFFHRASESLPTLLDNPYLVHFCDSRPLDQEWHSEPHDREVKNLETPLSKHPDYCTGKQAYRQFYDYYSIGIVLLELGSWSPLEEFIKRSLECASRPSAFRDKLIDKYAPRLSHIMGVRYADVTLACLRCEFGQGKLEGIRGSEPGQEPTELGDFFDKVVAPLGELARCPI